MRCLSCNKNLNDAESTRKYPDTNEYIDLCNRCFAAAMENNYDFQEETTTDEDEVGQST